MLDLSDIPSLLLVIGIELLLSIDNTFIMGSIASSVEQKYRKKIFFIGLASSILLRGIVLLLVTYLMRSPWLYLVGGVYLLFLAISYLSSLWSVKERRSLIKSSFWLAVVKIECIDSLFACDSMMAAIGIVGINPKELIISDKIWIVYLGIIIGMISVRCFAYHVSLLLSRCAGLMRVAHIVMAWIGIYLIAQGVNLFFSFSHIDLLTNLFWLGITLILILGFVWKVRNKR
ncbi:MAG: hypothetical protein VXZ72_00370 [Chlamydiota bacterium]|nr:hypothetical protein [Chlamydiota bacterium]